MMPLSPILLLLLAVLIHFGFLTRPLRRLGLSDRTGLLLALTMLFGSLIELSLNPRLTINLGTGVLPLVLAVSLLMSARRWWEPVVALGGAFTTAIGLALLSRWFPTGRPTELNLFFLDAQYFHALLAGAIGYLVGHTRPAAFAAAVFGVLAGDIYHYVTYLQDEANRDLVFRLSGGGFHGTALVAGMMALLLADLLTVAPAERGKVTVDHLP